MVDPSSKPDLGRVAVIGGCGFLGSHIVDALRSSCKAEIFVVSRAATRHPNHHSDVTYFDAEISKTTATGVPEIESVFEDNKIDVVFHTVSAPALTAKEKDFEETNVAGTKNIILAAQHAGVKALVYTSTNAVVRTSFKAGAPNSDESWPLILGKDQEDPYARSKAKAEKLVLEANHLGGLRTCTLRPGGMVGIRDNVVTPTIAGMYFSGNSNTQIGDDSGLSDYGSVLDSARAHVSAASERVDGEAFFITGEHIHFWAFARKFWKHFGDKGDKKPTVISFGMAYFMARVMTFFYGLAGAKPPLTVNDVHYIAATITSENEKAKKRLAYELREPLDVAIEKACKWYMENKGPKTL